MPLSYHDGWDLISWFPPPPPPPPGTTSYVQKVGMSCALNIITNISVFVFSHVFFVVFIVFSFTFSFPLPRAVCLLCSEFFFLCVCVVFPSIIQFGILNENVAPRRYERFKNVLNFNNNYQYQPSGSSTFVGWVLGKRCRRFERGRKNENFRTLTPLLAAHIRGSRRCC